MKRRTFIKNTAASTALLSVGGIALSCTEQEVKQITILHTNDVHSHIDPFGPNDGRNANKGGVARRATLIQRLRQENPNTLPSVNYGMRYSMSYCESNLIHPREWRWAVLPRRPLQHQ